MRFLLPSIALFLVPTLSPADAAPPKPAKGCGLAHIKQVVAASVKSGSKLDVIHCETALFSGPAAYVYVREKRRLKEGSVFYERRLVFDNDTGKPIVDEPARQLEEQR